MRPTLLLATLAFTLLFVPHVAKAVETGFATIPAEIACTISTFSDKELINLPWHRGTKLDANGFAPCMNYKNPWYPTP